MNLQKLLNHIAAKWPETVRSNPDNIGNLIGLPLPYTVPCVQNAFQELYYWDTYFTSRGLVLQGFEEQAKNNCDNLIYEIETLGFIPNGNRTFFLNRSQPPHFGALIDLVHQHFHDREWLMKAVAALEKELYFWTENRQFTNGLFHYGHNEKDSTIHEEFYRGCCVDRIGMIPNNDPKIRNKLGEHAIAEAESGWDFTPRFERRCMDYVPIDLNSLIFYNLSLLGRLNKELERHKQSDNWLNQAEKLREKINYYCWNGARGVFMDFDIKKKRHSPVLSAASLYPLWSGMATDTQACSTVKMMKTYLECPHGLSTCEPNNSGLNYQWDYPNGWPCLLIVALDGLSRYGFHTDVIRLAEKYINTVIRCFDLTGDIWEKYNVTQGTVEVKDEYQMPAMMGWSAAAVVVAAAYSAQSRNSDNSLLK